MKPIIDKNKREKTNWYVITGAPCSGKTTVVNMLRKRGYKTAVEEARHYLNTLRRDGKTVEEIEAHHREFQLGVLNMQIEQEQSLNPDDIVFLDRAIPDALAYYRFLNLDVDEKLTEALKSVSYKKVFILEYLPLVQDYARREDVTAQKKLHELITEVYTSLPFQVIKIPVLRPEYRIEIILKNL